MPTVEDQKGPLFDLVDASCIVVCWLAGVPFASAHETDDVVSWPLSGSNDTGWIQLDAIVGNDPILSVKQRRIGFSNSLQVQKFRTFHSKSMSTVRTAS